MAVILQLWIDEGVSHCDSAPKRLICAGVRENDGLIMNSQPGIPPVVASLLLVYAIISFVWPEKFTVLYWNREWSENRFVVRIVRAFVCLAAVFILIGIVSEFLEKAH
jgi:hypothetical protein